MDLLLILAIAWHVVRSKVLKLITAIVRQISCPSLSTGPLAIVKWNHTPGARFIFLHQRIVNFTAHHSSGSQHIILQIHSTSCFTCGDLLCNLAYASLSFSERSKPFQCLGHSSRCSNQRNLLADREFYDSHAAVLQESELACSDLTNLQRAFYLVWTQVWRRKD